MRTELKKEHNQSKLSQNIPFNMYFLQFSHCCANSFKLHSVFLEFMVGHTGITSHPLLRFVPSKFPEIWPVTFVVIISCWRLYY